MLNIFKRNKKSFSLILILIFTLTFLVACGSSDVKNNNLNVVDLEEEVNNDIELNDDINNEDTVNEVIEDDGEVNIDLKETNKVNVNNNLLVHFLDVGQGDSTFIEFGNKTMLIDGGDRGMDSRIIPYIKKLGYNKIDYLIATHPHSDHIGGLPNIIRSFEIGKVYMPNKSHTTKIFEELLLTIQSKGLTINPVKVGSVVNVDDSKITFLAPNENSSYDNLNDYSIAIKIEHGENSFILTGDAESTSEMQMVRSGIDLSADVLKAGHHGSDTSSINAFVSKVKPKYSVISAGYNNKYNHPNRSVVDRFKSYNAEVLITFEKGNIIFESDGSNLKYKTEKNESIYNQKTSSNQTINTKNNQASKSENINETVYVTKTGKKYHKDGCKHLKSKYPINKSEAINKGYEACKVCNP